MPDRPRCPRDRGRLPYGASCGRPDEAPEAAGRHRHGGDQDPGADREDARGGAGRRRDARGVPAAAVPGASTKDLDEVAAKVLADHGAKPNFLGYGGFPANICTSVNDIVVHGIPDKETVLKDGDLLSIDAGAIMDGWHGDAALTVFVGEGHSAELRELSRVTEESMWAGIAAMRKGNRLVDISRAVEGYIRRQPRPASGSYGIVEDYGGHGIGSQMHMDPHLLNYVDRRRGRGPKLVPGMCLAIEPMVTLGTPKTHVLSTTGRSRRTTAVVEPLGALGGADRGRPARTDRTRRRQGEARRARGHGGPRSAGASPRPRRERAVNWASSKARVPHWRPPLHNDLANRGDCPNSSLRGPCRRLARRSRVCRMPGGHPGSRSRKVKR